MWATILKVVLSKMELKHLAILAVVAVFAGLYFQQSKIQELEADLAEAQAETKEAEDRADNYWDKMRYANISFQKFRRSHTKIVDKYKTENGKLRKIITEFKTTINNIELKASEIKLQKERLEKQLENLKAKHDYLNHPVPTDIAEWMLQ